MAACHLRSISLPSGSHTLVSSVEEQLNKLKASESSRIGCKLSGLKYLYECIDDLLQLPNTQQTLFHEKQSQFVEDALDGSIRLLDMCCATRDFLTRIRGFMQELELSLRRRRAGDTSLTSDVDAYIISRKNLNKVICKYRKNLKKQEKNREVAALQNNTDPMSTISMLKTAKEISIATFESIISFISHQKPKSKSSGWSIIVSNILQAKRASCEGKAEASEAEKIDVELLALKSSKDSNSVNNVLKGLEELESSIQETEEELECVYRRLVKTRVSLLNSLNS